MGLGRKPREEERGNELGALVWASIQAVRKSKPGVALALLLGCRPGYLLGYVRLDWAC